MEGEEEEVVDDGNVDYCFTCGGGGDLLCCDRCPRSFHQKCVGISGSLPEGEWKCPFCVTAFGAHGQYVDSAAGPIVTCIYPGPFNGAKATKPRIEAEIADLVETLRDHEFGPPFGQAVDTDMLPDYLSIIKKPMDLGKITGKMSRKHYGSGDAFDAARALADIRLVWYNCKKYNTHMSTIWRFADVLSRETETAIRDRMKLTPEQAARLIELTRVEMPAESGASDGGSGSASEGGAASNKPASSPAAVKH